MSYKYIGFQEESTYGTEWTVGNPGWHFLRLLDESIVTERSDFFPETTDYWTNPAKAEGFFRTQGTANVLLDPVVFPWILQYFMGDPTSSTKVEELGTDDAYKHIFKFGGTESLTTGGGTGVKPITVQVGVGIEKDRQLLGCVIPKLSIEATSRESVSVGIDVFGRGNEKLITADTPSYTAYTQPHFTFNSAAIMTIGGTIDSNGDIAGGTDRLTTQPTIEAFRLDLERGYDRDYYPIGSRYVGAPIMSGMATVGGSMDFTFESEDEHERFMNAVNGTETGNQATFPVKISFRGSAIGASVTYYYQVDFILPSVHYTKSGANVKSRDRIVQTVDFKGIYNSTVGCAAQVNVFNITTAYTT